jgi:hypothetical protein
MRNRRRLQKRNKSRIARRGNKNSRKKSLPSNRGVLKKTWAGRVIPSGPFFWTRTF